MEHFKNVKPTYIRAVGIILCAVILAIVVLIALGRNDQVFPKELPGGFRQPIIALELVATPADIIAIVGSDGDVRRDKVRQSLQIDDMVIIRVYLLLLIAMSLLLAHRRFPFAVAFAIASAVCATGAAVFDYLENAAIRVAINAPANELTQQMADQIRTMSLWKWGLLFLSIGLTSTLFFWRRDWIVIIGGLYLLTALIGLFGLYRHAAIEWAYLPMAAGMICVAVAFTFFPLKVLRSP